MTADLDAPLENRAPAGAGNAAFELERASQADHETRLQVLEEIYRSLEAELDAAGSEALR